MGSKNSKKSYTIAMVGLDGAGKSSMSMIKYLESQDKKKNLNHQIHQIFQLNLLIIKE